MSRFLELPVSPPDPAFSLVAAYEKDNATEKVNLCPGFYRDEEGKPWILPAVAQAKTRIHADPSLDHEHLPLSGHPELVSCSQKLLFGAQSDLGRVASMQTVSGTGANHVASVFLTTTLNPKHVWISNPSWINYTEIWKMAGPEVQQRLYPYYDPGSQGVDFEGMIETLQRDAEAGDVIILQACAHNPTGADLSVQQWETVAALCQELGLFALFDIAYQGFASGDLTQDAFAISHFFGRGDLEFAVAQSFSKNFGLYGERIGMVHVVAQTATLAARIDPLLIKISRAEITSCPSYGARIVAKILQDPVLHQQWLMDLETMSTRMKAMREALFKELQRHNVKGSWDHLLSDIGMFSMTGLDKTQVTELRDTHHVYLLPSGRISVTGLTTQNVAIVARAFRSVLGSR